MTRSASVAVTILQCDAELLTRCRSLGNWLTMYMVKRLYCTPDVTNRFDTGC